MSKVQLRGADELKRKVRRAKSAVSRREIDTALKAGAQPIADQAKFNAPVGPTRMVTTRNKDGTETRKRRKGGTLRKAIRVRKLRKRGTEAGAIKIGTRGGRSKINAPHAALIEMGTAERFQKTTGRRAGRVRPNPFLGRADRSKRPLAELIIRRMLQQAIDRELAKR